MLPHEKNDFFGKLHKTTRRLLDVQDCSVLFSSTVTRHINKIKRNAAIAPRGVIAVASRELGVTREHLSRVLHGHRTSRSLTARYTAFLATWEKAA